MSLQEKFAGMMAQVEHLRARHSPFHGAESARQVEALFQALLMEAFNE